MKKTSLLLLALALLTQFTFAQKKSPAEQLGWKLGSQAYTFKNFTFAEALDKIKGLGLQYVEGFPGQQIGNDIKGTMAYDMDAATRQKVKDLLKSKGIKMLAYGVVTGKDEEDWKKIFEFAKAMGIPEITSEPPQEELEMVNRLAGEYNVKVALHNHPKPSRYWNPDIVLEAIKGRKHIGACADVGHWIRSGLDPVESLKKLEGHIISLHFKDLNEKAREAHDVPWGTGISNVDAMLKELKRQGFKGLFSIEYEYHWDNSVPEIAKSVEFFNKEAQKL